MNEPVEALRDALSGRYAIERELGRGGMAVVYLARDLRHRRPVALKVLEPELAAAIGPARFHQEIEIAARLSHPHILPVHDSGEAAGMLFYVMPFVEEESLRDRLRREKQLSVEEAVRIVRETADALDHAHRHGVVHRDIKPDNILLHGGHAVVADFGIARPIEDPGATRLTATGLAMGTPAYMSPEQTLSSSVDARSDIYSLTCVLYETLVGQPPFTGATPEAIFRQHLSAEPPSASMIRPGIPASVEAAIRRGLSKSPADRFANARAFADALTDDRPDDGSQTVAIPRRWRGRVAPWLAYAAAPLLIAVAAWWAIDRVGVKPRGAAQPAGPRQWVLVADFEAPPEDSTLAVAAHDLVVAALDQSALVAPLPADQIRLALRGAGRSPDTRVDADLAREIAYRRAVRAVIAGRINRVGRGFSMVLRAVDAESLEVIHAVTGSAAGEDQLIGAVGSMAEKLRESLGEKRDALRAARPLVEAVTPSFDAFRSFVRGTSLMAFNWNPEAIVWFRDAVGKDPGFASAWSAMGHAYSNLGIADSALWAWDRAMQMTDRLSPQQRLGLEARVALLRGDQVNALKLVDQALVYDPGAPGLLNTRANVLAGLGRDEEALQGYQEALRRMPLGAPEALLWNESTQLMLLGRLDEAAREVGRMRSESRWRKQVELALVAEDWSRAESLGAAVAGMDIGTDYRVMGMLGVGGGRAARGALRSAQTAFRRAREIGSDGFAPVERVMAERCLVLLGTVGAPGQPHEAQDAVGEESTSELLTAAWRAATTGDAARASQLVARARTRPADERVQDGATPLSEAWVAAAAGRWADVVRIAGPLARAPHEPGSVVYPMGVTPARWLAAEAFERLEQPDSAAAYLETVIQHPRTPAEDGPYRAVVHSFAHQRLAMLYARMGRLEDAERHWKAFQAACRRPDPEVELQLAEARRAVTTAVQMQRGSSP